MANQTLDQQLKEAVQRALTEQLSTIAEEVITEATATFKRRAQGLVAQVACSVFKHYSMQRIGNDLVITVKIEQPTPVK